jgi:D-alanine--poly(phosphoribitol) ligase subunit 2
MTHEELIQLLVEVTGSSEVRKNPQLKLYDTQVLDSMRTVELFLALDEQWGINISPAEFDREAWATPELFIQDVEARAAQA